MDATQRTDIEVLTAELKKLSQIRDELKESQERFSLILNANNDGIWDWNLQNNKLFFSPRWKEMLGYAEEDLTNQYETWVNLLHENDRNYAVHFLQSYLERKVTPFRLEFRLRCKNGDYKWILSRGKAVWDKNGKPVRMAGSHTDITERKHREKMLQNLAKREHLLSDIARQLLDQDFESVIQFILQKIGKFTESEQSYIIRYSDNQEEWSMFYEWCNPRNEQLKSSLEHYQNQTVNRFPWFADQLLKGQPIIINSNDDFPEQAIIEKEFFSKSITPHLLIVPMISSKKIVGYLGLEANSIKYWTTEDVNWLKLVGEFIAIAQARLEAEKALLTAKENADLANQAKSKFLANMSHELRTPLNAILGFTQVMNRDTSLSQEQRENLKIINRSGEHLLVLINDILEMSKIEAGRVTFHPTIFDLYALLESLQDMFSLKAKTKHLQLIFEKSIDVPQYISTDEGKLRQIIINLLSNAIKFTEKGKVTLRVKQLEIRKKYQEIILSFEIEDTGIGIDLSEKDQLFEPFTQTLAGLNSQEGTGLGLSISQKFVQLMGGQIKVQSSLGEGSLFRFDIVAKVVQPKQIAHHNLSSRIIRLAPNQPIYRILVVDDVLESRLLLVKLLSSVGFLVEQATNGKEAIALWKSWKPHLIFMDLKMPIMNGYEAIQQIRNFDHSQITFIIALTANIFQEDMKQFLAIEYDDFMLKPFQEDVLLQKIAQYLKVEYIYENQKQQNFTVVQQDKVLSQLKLMPDEWQNKVKIATQECSDDSILQLLPQIPLDSTDLSNYLQELADNFRFDLILELVAKK
ncbi:ATP-binding protein [Chroococcus sp. FPU101]|uniref:ATP-binding protein n=1 Tax=Chroococcus sp. FPU101 TaxID=1974212 RepID=UPI001A8D7C0D|nr:ATP-binding protein [Chroococcus sp. FPU101]GFE70187.1 two-component hybrid histidine kinase [Chroococcus sp. FPU101]